jgi:hypothetical protein
MRIYGYLRDVPVPTCAAIKPGGIRLRQSMIRKSGDRFSEKIMLKQEDGRRA